MIGPMLAVLGKELADNLRDRRSVLSALVYPLIGPLVLGATLTLVSDWQKDDRLELPVVGAEHAPSLITALRENGVTILPPPDDPESEVRDGKADAVLIIGEDYPERFRQARSAPLQLLVDDSRNKARARSQKVHQLIAGYGSQIGALRLLARGVSPELAAAVAVERVDLSTPEKLAARILNVLPLFLLMAAFIGGMQVAIDTTAGERERGSLEPLLLNPVSRGALVAGKWLTSVLFAGGVVSLTLAGFVVMSRVVPLEEIGIRLHLGASEVAVLLATVLPLVLLASALQVLVATFARSFKEAQMYLSLLLFAPVIPGLVLGLHPVETSSWMMLVPGLAQQQLITMVVSGEAISPASVLVAGACSVAFGVLLIGATARLFLRESIIFGR